MAALDPNSPTYEADLAAFIAGYDSEDATEEAALAAQAVEDAQGVIDAANGTLLNAQAATVAGTADGNAVVAGLESFTANTRATDANIARAVTEAQALVEADEASYTDAGVKVSDDSAEPEAGYVALYTDGQTVQTTEGQGFEFIGFANEKPDVDGTPAGLTAQTVSSPSNASALVATYNLNFNVANDATETFTVVIDSQTYTVDVTADNTGVITTAVFQTDPAATAKIASADIDVATGTLTITGETGAANAFTFGDATGEALTNSVIGANNGTQAADAVAEVVTIQGGAVVDANFTGEIALTVDGNDYTVEVVEGVFNTDDLAAIAAEANIATAEQNGFDLVLTGEVAGDIAADFDFSNTQAVPAIDPVYTEGDLLDVYSAEELQTLAAEAQADLDADIDSDGNNVALLNNLKDALVTFIANGGDSTTVVGSYEIAGQPEINVSAAALIDQWTALLENGDEQAIADAADEFVQTLAVAFAPVEPNANQQLLIDSLEAVTDRAGLENGVTAAEAAFNVTDSGAVLEAANNLQDDRDQLMQDITDAQAGKVAAEEYQATIDALLAEHDAIVGNIEDIQQQLEDLGVENLIELGNANTGGTLLGADLFVYTEETENLTISRFEADDQLFLGNFTRINLGADDDLTTDRLGDSATLEFFVEQAGNNVLLHIETQAFAGNDTGAIATSDFTTIQINGVQSEALQFENGFLTIA